jgi:HD-GYP domain-containing protein (c-di-GMP phosphodiesterase class II)
MKKKVAVTDLQFGMYVYELDRPWTDTPFVFQGFVIKTQQQLDVLHKFCKHVFVDTVRAEGEAPPEAALPAGAGPIAADLHGTGKVIHVERASVEMELANATEVRASAELTVQRAFEAIRGEEALDSSEVKLAVGNMTDSMLRNPDAMILFNSLHERGGYQLMRAIKVSTYMIAFARFLGMDAAAIERAGMVGLLQDVGMLKIPEEIRAKKGRLTPQEMEMVRGHVAQTVEQLRQTPGLSPEIAEVAALHHERHDGSGYPLGKKGASLGVLGAIAGIVDVFDALTSERPYAAPMSPSNALNFLTKLRDKAFHPVLVEQFVRCIGFFPVGSVVELNTGEVGIVISQNPAKRLLPRVILVRDEQGNPMRPQKLLDLARLPTASGGEAYRVRRTLEYGKAGVSAKDILFA